MEQRIGSRVCDQSQGWVFSHNVEKILVVDVKRLALPCFQRESFRDKQLIHR